jgi:hypothetical protein
MIAKTLRLLKKVAKQAQISQQKLVKNPAQRG